MDVFKETDYRKIVQGLFFTMPNHGHGQVSRLARHLSVNTTLVSQILSGKRNFTEEQAVETAKFLKLNKKEGYYFLLLVLGERAGTGALKDVFAEQLRQVREEAAGVKGRISSKKELTFEEQAVFYSSWLYSAVHILPSIEGFDEPNAIARRLGIEVGLVRRIVDRLVEYGILVEEGGRLKIGAASTYVPPDSPLVHRHHQSWRQQASQQMTLAQPKDFFFTAPLSISADDFDLFRKELAELINRLQRVVEKTNPEELACLNIDFFKV